MAASIMPFFVIMCEFFNGILQPQYLMPDVWAYTMYYVGPFTYWISGIVAMVLTGLQVECQESELTRFQPAPGSTCGQYAQDWLASSQGYLSNPNATSDCGYCQYAFGQDVSPAILAREKALISYSICRPSTCRDLMRGLILESSHCSRSQITCLYTYGYTSSPSRIGCRGEAGYIVVHHLM